MPMQGTEYSRLHLCAVWLCNIASQSSLQNACILL